MTLHDAEQAAKRQAIRQALERHQGNRTHAAAELGITRRHLRRLLAEEGLGEMPRREPEISP